MRPIRLNRRQPKTGSASDEGVHIEKYGPPETLRITEVEKPAPAADEVLVKVLAVSVNPAD
jgi:NADPH:quinone reductase-like Zn-dependent oxidoreductase